jgi:hypothetical protein
MKLKREIFSRPNRMVHKFGELLEREDPLGVETFDFHRPMRVSDHSDTARPATSQQYGLHNYRPDPSPVVKPNGECAHSDGPTLDVPMDFAMPIPVGTKRRLGPLRTDK